MGWPNIRGLIRLLVIDAEPVVLRGVEVALRPDSRIEMRFARSLAEALALLAAFKADAVVFDPDLNDSVGIATIAALRRACPSARLLAFSAQRPRSDIDGAGVAAGADGWLSKQSDPAELAPLVWGALGAAGHAACGTQDEPGLSAAEWRVARLVAAGLTNAQIAAELHVSVNTVKSHLAHVMSRFGWRRRSELARAWSRVGRWSRNLIGDDPNHPNG